MVRGLKFRIKEEWVLYYRCSENKGADQLRGHREGDREADLRLCFRICKKPVFSRRGSYRRIYWHKFYSCPIRCGIIFSSTILCFLPRLVKERNGILMSISVHFSDNVCTESFSLKMTKRTLEKCQQQIESLTRHITR